MVVGAGHWPTPSLRTDPASVTPGRRRPWSPRDSPVPPGGARPALLGRCDPARRRRGATARHHSAPACTIGREPSSSSCPLARPTASTPVARRARAGRVMPGCYGDGRATSRQPMVDAGRQRRTVPPPLRWGHQRGRPGRLVGCPRYGGARAASDGLPWCAAHQPDDTASFRRDRCRRLRSPA
jgi:hypothetical protein